MMVTNQVQDFKVSEVMAELRTNNLLLPVELTKLSEEELKK